MRVYNLSMAAKIYEPVHRPSKPRILAVDDEPYVLDILERLLVEHGYEYQGVLTGEEALSVIEEDPPDILLLDLRMPGVDGFEVLERIRSNERLGYIPVIVLTALDKEQVEAFRKGADDFLSKPPNENELVARIESLLRLKSYIRELESAEQVLFSLATIIEMRDAYTEQHTERVVEVSLKIGRIVGLTPQELDDLRKGAHLHDIGKVAIPDEILKKKGPLTPEERKRIEEHVIIGEQICAPIHSLRGALPIIRHHHERWDGTGYPDGLREHEIPFLARIVAIADAFDAMSYDRPYRKRLSREQLMEEFEKGKGKQWDPNLTEILLGLLEEGEL